MRLLFAGEGGQGVQVIAQILAKAAFLANKSVLYIPNFGVEQRGGVSLAFLTIDNQNVSYPKFRKADLAAIFSQRSTGRIKSYLDNKTKIIYGPAFSNGIKTNLPAKVWNIVILGHLNNIGKIVNPELLIQALNERFAVEFKKNPELKKLDLEALNI